MGKIYSIVFSPTGGTKKAADMIAETAGMHVEEIDLTDRTVDFSKYSFEQDDVCFVSVPSYGGRVPNLAVTRLQQMKGNGAAAVLVVVYGNRHYDDTFAELQDALEEAGFYPMAAVAALAEHSIVRSLASGRPDEADKEQLKEFADKIWAKVKGGSRAEKLQLPGNRPYKEFGGGMNPMATDSCVQCGTCAKACPAEAIPADAPNTTNAEKCISCMRCISVCPMEARMLNEQMFAGITERLTTACAQRRENELFL